MRRSEGDIEAKKGDRQKRWNSSTEIDLKNLLILVRYGWYHRLEQKSQLLLRHGEVFESKEARHYTKLEGEPFGRELLSHFLPADTGSRQLGRGGGADRAAGSTPEEAYQRLLGEIRSLSASPWRISSSTGGVQENQAILNGKYL